MKNHRAAYSFAKLVLGVALMSGLTGCVDTKHHPGPRYPARNDVSRSDMSNSQWRATNSAETTDRQMNTQK